MQIIHILYVRVELLYCSSIMVIVLLQLQYDYNSYSSNSYSNIFLVKNLVVVRVICTGVQIQQISVLIL